jgi:endonuclease III
MGRPMMKSHLPDWKKSRAEGGAVGRAQDGIVAFFLRGDTEDSTGWTPPPREELFDLLVGTILSQNTNDRNSSRAHLALQDLARGRSHESITPRFILSTPRRAIEKAIFSSGYYHAKADKIIRAAAYVEEFGFPKTREELLKVPGVGEKTADIVLAFGYGQDRIVIDTHVWRVAERLGLAPRKASYDVVQSSLDSIFPEGTRTQAHVALISYGRTVCTARKPRCGDCPLYAVCLSKGAW